MRLNDPLPPDERGMVFDAGLTGRPAGDEVDEPITFPWNRFRLVSVTLAVTEPPWTTVWAEGLTEIAKSGREIAAVNASWSTHP